MISAAARCPTSISGLGQRPISTTPSNSDRPAREIAATDAVALFDELGLREHLTAQRSNGLVAMVNRIRTQAQAQTH